MSLSRRVRWLDVCLEGIGRSGYQAERLGEQLASLDLGTDSSSHPTFLICCLVSSIICSMIFDHCLDSQDEGFLGLLAEHLQQVDDFGVRYLLRPPQPNRTALPPKSLLSVQTSANINKPIHVFSSWLDTGDTPGAKICLAVSSWGHSPVG